jgi:ABC-type transport system involved in multi-copper enzyme maturation permease subunit
LETTASSVQEKPAHLSFINKVMDNPIIAKELKGRMRGRQGFILLTAYLALVSLVIVAAYYYSVGDWNASRITPDALAETGKRIFGMVVLFEFALIVFIGPALTSGAISSERERGTFDLLRVSLLSPRSLIFGKLGAAIAYLLLLILAALPLQSLAFFLGGVGLEEMVVSLVMLTTSTLLFCTLGIYFSGIARRTVVATVMSYASLIFPVVLLGILYILLENGDIDFSSLSTDKENLLIFFLWTLLSTNPFTAGLVSELMLEQEHLMFMFYPPDFPCPIFSPWILYTVFSVTMTLLMIWLIVFYMNRHER